MRNRYLTILAGKKAWSRIKEEGLKPDMVRFVTGAAGGPKGMVLNHFDRMLFSSWFAGRKQPLDLYGSSVGAWRFSAVTQANPIEAIDRLWEAYISQVYLRQPSPTEVTEKSIKILEDILGSNGIEEILNHPYLRLNLIVARSKWSTAFKNANLLKLGLVAPVIANLFNRKYLDHFFERTLFHHPDSLALENEKNFKLKSYPLSVKNLAKVLLASGSIPVVMDGVEYIPGVPKGIYRDGGMVDYHMDLPLAKENEIVLLPHYTNRISPGWLDKHVSWRRPEHVDNILLVCPSNNFIKQLPYGKIPDRSDFVTLAGKDKERFSYWNKVIERSKWLADEFWELTQTGKIKDRVRLLS